MSFFKKDKKLDLQLEEKLVSIIRNRLFIPRSKEYFEKAGLNLEETALSKYILNLALFLNFIFSIYTIYRLFILKPDLMTSVAYFLLSVVVGLIVILLILWFGFYFFVDMKIRKNAKSDIEKSASEKKRQIKEFFEKAGIDLDLNNLSLAVFRFAVGLNLFLNIYLFYFFSGIKPGIIYAVIITLVLWTLGFILLLLVLWAMFFAWVDLRIYKRKVEIEEVLPDFLQLTSANISAGMPIDQALWFAVRPRFGILAKEIEDVAKSTLVGERLDVALTKFAKKYDSLILQRSVNLLLEGMSSGGKVGDLLNRIANNISETRIIRKEMASSVTTYVIFIGFATLMAAPFLFGLSTELVIIMTSIMTNVAASGGMGGSSTGGMASMFTISEPSINVNDYRIFAYCMISVSSFFSAVIISIIRKGNVKEGLHLIPMFIIAGLVIYTIAAWFMGSLLGGFFV